MKGCVHRMNNIKHYKSRSKENTSTNIRAIILIYCHNVGYYLKMWNFKKSKKYRGWKDLRIFHAVIVFVDRTTYMYSLELRRLHLDLMFCYKPVFSLVSVKFPDFLSSVLYKRPEVMRTSCINHGLTALFGVDFMLGQLWTCGMYHLTVKHRLNVQWETLTFHSIWDATNLIFDFTFYSYCILYIKVFSVIFRQLSVHVRALLSCCSCLIGIIACVLPK